MRGALGILATYLAVAAQADPSGPRTGWNDGSYGHGIPDQPKRVIPKGCKLFRIYGVEIVAISEKSARKKYDKMQRRKEGNP